MHLNALKIGYVINHLLLFLKNIICFKFNVYFPRSVFAMHTQRIAPAY